MNIFFFFFYIKVHPIQRPGATHFGGLLNVLCDRNVRGGSKAEKDTWLLNND